MNALSGIDRCSPQAKTCRVVTPAEYSKLADSGQSFSVASIRFVPDEDQGITQKAVMQSTGITNPALAQEIKDPSKENITVCFADVVSPPFNPASIPQLYTSSSLPDEWKSLPQGASKENPRLSHLPSAARQAFIVYYLAEHKDASREDAIKTVDKKYKEQINDPLEFIKWVKENWDEEHVQSIFSEAFGATRTALLEAQGAFPSIPNTKDILHEDLYYYTPGMFVLKGENTALFSAAAAQPSDHSDNADSWAFLSAARKTAAEKGLLERPAWESNPGLKERLRQAFKKANRHFDENMTLGQMLDLYEETLIALEKKREELLTTSDGTNIEAEDSAPSDIDEDEVDLNIKQNNKLFRYLAPLLPLLQMSILNSLEMTYVSSQSDCEGKLTQTFAGIYQEVQNEHYARKKRGEAGLPGYPEDRAVLGDREIRWYLEAWGNLQAEKTRQERQELLRNYSGIGPEMVDELNEFTPAVSAKLPRRAKREEEKEALYQLYTSGDLDTMRWVAFMAGKLTTSGRQQVEEAARQEAVEVLLYDPALNSSEKTQLRKLRAERDALFATVQQAESTVQELSRKEKKEKLTKEEKERKADAEERLRKLRPDVGDGKINRFDLSALGDKKEKVWNSLIQQGYIDEEGNLLPKFNGDLDNFDHGVSLSKKEKAKLEKILRRFYDSKKRMASAEQALISSAPGGGRVFEKEFVYQLWTESRKIAQHPAGEDYTWMLRGGGQLAREEIYKRLKHEKPPSGWNNEEYFAALYGKRFLTMRLAVVYSASRDKTSDEDEDIYLHSQVNWQEPDNKWLLDFALTVDKEGKAYFPAELFTSYLHSFGKETLQKYFPGRLL